MVGLCAATGNDAHAQSKPKLVPITLDDKTNDPKAVELAKKLNPNFFKVDLDYTNDFNDAKYFARFINFGSGEKQKKMMIVNAYDSYFYCTKYGCPFLIYENTSSNKWKLISKITSYRLIYDKSSRNPARPNIIGQTYDPRNGKKTEVYLWNGLGYRKVER